MEILFLTLMIFAGLEFLRILFSVAVTMFISCALAILSLLACELYPTEIRATGFACATIIGRLGFIIAPHLVGWMVSK